MNLGLLSRSWVLLPLALLLLALAAACQSGQQSAAPWPGQVPPGSSANAAPSATSTEPEAKAQGVRPAPPAEPPANAAAPAGTGGAPGDTLGKIYLQEFGKPLSQEDMNFTRRSLAYFFPNQVVVLPPRELPQEAYYPPRQRYRAEKILDALVRETPEDAQVVVGLTTVDISTTKGPYEDWGILGLATVSGRECVISRFRAAREAKNDLHTRQRLAKVVVHEIGHTLGLPHCPHHTCLMEDGKGSVLTTDHELDFCPTCRETVGARLLSASGPLPWDPPAHLTAPQE